MAWRILVAAGALACAAGFAVGEEPNRLIGQCGGLPEALRQCAPETCAQPHPFVPGFEISHRVEGLLGEACAYRQSMPAEMSMSCQLSAAGREEMAHLVEEMAQGRMSGGTGRDTVTTRECQVRDRSGAVIPWN